MAYMIAGHEYDQTGFDFVQEYTHRLGCANMEQFVQAQIAPGTDTQPFAFAQVANIPAQPATPDVTTLMATMMQMMRSFQNDLTGVGAVPNGVQAAHVQPDRDLANAPGARDLSAGSRSSRTNVKIGGSGKCASLLL